MLHQPRQTFREYSASYKLASGDRITFYCNNVADGKVVGKTITNNFDTTMELSYSELDQSLVLVSLSGE